MQVSFSYGASVTASVSDSLRAAGLRRTPARLAVFARVNALARPVSHAELLACPDIADVDDITLYRTLTALVDAGLVHRVHGLDGVWRYCAQPQGQAGCPANHVHFLCTSCGAMACLLDQPMPRVDVPKGALVHGRHFIIHGHCAACLAQRVALPRPAGPA